MPGKAVLHLGDRVAHRLHEAVDQRGRQVGAGGGVDASGRHETTRLSLQEARFPLGTLRRRLDRGQRPCHAQAHRVDRVLVTLGVLFEQHFLADRLFGQGGAAGGECVAGRGVWSGSWSLGCVRVAARRACAVKRGPRWARGL